MSDEVLKKVERGVFDFQGRQQEFLVLDCDDNDREISQTDQECHYKKRDFQNDPRIIVGIIVALIFETEYQVK